MKISKTPFFFRYTYPLDDIASWEKALTTKKESFWVNRGKKMQLALFDDMARRVPAYKQFLKKHKIDPKKIRTHNDLLSVPTINKDNYLRAYPLSDLSWDGRLGDVHHIISATSGSTGEPFYFPRTTLQDQQYALLAELYLRTNFQIQNKRTLLINAFPLGVWIGGLFTYAAITTVAERGSYALSLINPGINIPATLRAVKKFGAEFDQIIIASYGPFLKDILDEGAREGIKWKTLDLGFIFSAEGFNESFRDHVLTHTNKKNKITASLNHYGTVDLGTMSYETPLAILARKTIERTPDLRNTLFHEPFKTPTLTQFIPELFYFEQTADAHLLVSGYSGLPLVRYDLNDYGHVYSKEHLSKEFADAGEDVALLAQKSGIAPTIWNLPFVQVFERTDFSVSYFAFQIYPETVRRAVGSDEFSAICSGKFTLLVTFDQHHHQRLEVHVEQMPHVRSVSLRAQKRLQRKVHDQLMKESSEYEKTFHEKGIQLFPQIVMHTHGDPAYFPSGGKQKWVK